LQLLPIVARIT